MTLHPRHVAAKARRRADDPDVADRRNGRLAPIESRRMRGVGAALCLLAALVSVALGFSCAQLAAKAALSMRQRHAAVSSALPELRKAPDRRNAWSEQRRGD